MAPTRLTLRSVARFRGASTFQPRACAFLADAATSMTSLRSRGKGRARPVRRARRGSTGAARACEGEILPIGGGPRREGGAASRLRVGMSRALRRRMLVPTRRRLLAVSVVALSLTGPPSSFRDVRAAEPVVLVDVAGPGPLRAMTLAEAL